MCYVRIRETIETTSQHLDLHELIEYRTDPHYGQTTITTSALICRSPLKILGAPPHGKAKEKDIVKDNGDLSLGTTDVELKPGENEVAIPVKVSTQRLPIIICANLHDHVKCKQNLS